MSEDMDFKFGMHALRIGPDMTPGKKFQKGWWHRTPLLTMYNGDVRNFIIVKN